MSLRDAVQSVVDEMEQRASEPATFTTEDIRWFVKILKIALRSSQGEIAPIPPQPILSPETQHMIQVEKARAEIRAKRNAEDAQGLEKEGGERMILCVGGPADATMTLAPMHLVEGQSRTKIAGGVYVYKGGQLHFEG